MKQTKKVVLYLRLSKEDLDKNINEEISESIKNQELMLLDEVKKHPDWKIVNIYSDEDFSGAGTYRPDFEKMLKSCEKGEVDIVLCKSQSRFSRDMEIIEKYIHNKFKEWNIRFISLIDNADTNNVGNKKARQINALVNEWFLEDLSNNIKATFRTKWKAGECTSSFAKYGLMKDPKNKNHLLIDPIASEVLKQIANMFLAGYGQDKIAYILEQKKIPSPYEYKKLNGCRLKLPITKNENKTIISKPGEYIVRIFLYNNYKEILKNIRSIFIFSTEEKIINNSIFNIKIRSISEDLKLYYTTDHIGNNLVDCNLNNIDFNNTNIWKKLKVNDTVPNNTYYIASKNEKLDRLLETGFELEIKLKENQSHNIYKLFTKSIATNTTTSFSFKYEIRKKYKWSGRVIYNMLRDEIYNGTLIQGKTKRISYKNHKCIKTNKENWVSQKNALEKIFDDNTWYTIQRKLDEKSKAGATGTKHIFSGKIYCDICGSILHKNCSYNNNNNKIEYLICKDKQNKWSNCDNKKAIRLNILEEHIIKSINYLISVYYDFNILKNLYKKSINTFKEELESLTTESKKINLIIENKKNLLNRLYEDHYNSIIDDDDFRSFRTKTKEEITNFSQRLDIIKNELKLIEIKQKKLEDKDNLLLSYKHINKLTPKLIDEFIFEIRIGKIKNNNEREIKIFWNIPK